VHGGREAADEGDQRDVGVNTAAGPAYQGGSDGDQAQETGPARRPDAHDDERHAGEVRQDEAVLIQDVALADGQGRRCTDFGFGDPLRVRVRCLATRRVERVQCRITVRGDYAPLFEAVSEPAHTWSAGGHTLECVFAELPLLPGLYRCDVQLTFADTPRWSLPQAVAAFRVVTDLADYGSTSLVGTTKSRGGFLAVAYDWRLHSADGEQPLSGLHLPRTMSASRPP
jgi:hypothetical protein